MHSELMNHNRRYSMRKKKLPGGIVMFMLAVDFGIVVYEYCKGKKLG